jgi:hypothetical protein
MLAIRAISVVPKLATSASQQSDSQQSHLRLLYLMVTIAGSDGDSARCPRCFCQLPDSRSVPSSKDLPRPRLCVPNIAVSHSCVRLCEGPTGSVKGQAPGEMSVIACSLSRVWPVASFLLSNPTRTSSSAVTGPSALNSPLRSVPRFPTFRNCATSYQYIAFVL